MTCPGMTDKQHSDPRPFYLDEEWERQVRGARPAAIVAAIAGIVALGIVVVLALAVFYPTQSAQ